MRGAPHGSELVDSQDEKETAMPFVIKVLGIIALVWIGFIVLGWIFKALFWVLVIGAAVFVGSAAYAALKSRSNPNVLNR